MCGLLLVQNYVDMFQNEHKHVYQVWVGTYKARCPIGRELPPLRRWVGCWEHATCVYVSPLVVCSPRIAVQSNMQTAGSSVRPRSVADGQTTTSLIQFQCATA